MCICQSQTSNLSFSPLVIISLFFTSVTLIFVLEIHSFVPFVSHSLWGHTCPRACLTSGIFTTALSLSLDGYKAKAGKHWPSELGNHLWASSCFLSHCKWNSQSPGENKKGGETKTKTRRDELTHLQLLCSQPCSQNSLISPRGSGKVSSVCVSVCVWVCVQVGEATIQYLWSPSYKCGPDAS